MPAEGTKEWRVDLPEDMVGAADAILVAYGLNRTKFTAKVFAEVINRIAHQHKLIATQSRGNPLLSDPSAPQTDFGGI